MHPFEQASLLEIEVFSQTTQDTKALSLGRFNFVTCPRVGEMVIVERLGASYMLAIETIIHNGASRLDMRDDTFPCIRIYGVERYSAED